MAKIAICDDGPDVFVNVDDRVYFAIDPAHARDVADALIAKAAVADEYRQASRIIEDQAILIQYGIHVGLTDNKAMLREAHKVAAGKIGGIKQDVVLGKPRINHT